LHNVTKTISHTHFKQTGRISSAIVKKKKQSMFVLTVHHPSPKTHGVFIFKNPGFSPSDMRLEVQVVDVFINPLPVKLALIECFLQYSIIPGRPCWQPRCEVAPLLVLVH
jgi:hypothetical protein